MEKEMKPKNEPPDDAITKWFGWVKKAEKALAETGQEYGEVEFDCPICGAKSRYVCLRAAGSHHRSTIHVYCEGCPIRTLT